MIYTNRNRNDENGIPIRPSKEWIESSKAETEIAIKEGKNHSAKGAVYAHNQVRVALEKLFHDKCAYCESKITATDDWNVEHFRPKGRVAERSDHPGYYWLTYDWENLYPSCTHCNQRRKDKPVWGDLHYAHAGGKMDQFPLEIESTRAMSHDDDMNQEDILLIDPCKDNPEQFFSYDITGQIVSSGDNLRGRATIDICHLERRRLRNRRREKMKTAIDMLKLIYKSNNEVTKDAAKKFMHDNLLDNKCEYAGVARTVNNDQDAFGV